jgi:hypothetical protein
MGGGRERCPYVQQILICTSIQTFGYVSYFLMARVVLLGHFFCILDLSF